MAEHFTFALRGRTCFAQPHPSTGNVGVDFKLDDNNHVTVFMPAKDARRMMRAVEQAVEIVEESAARLPAVAEGANA